MSRFWFGILLLSLFFIAIGSWIMGREEPQTPLAPSSKPAADNISLTIDKTSLIADNIEDSLVIDKLIGIHIISDSDFLTAKDFRSYYGDAGKRRVIIVEQKGKEFFSIEGDGRIICRGKQIGKDEEVANMIFAAVYRNRELISSPK